MSRSDKQEAAAARELEDLIKKRNSFKGRMSIFDTFLQSLDLASITSHDILKLELRIQKLESLYALYDETQSKLECMSNLETQITEREEFESQYYDLICKAQEIVKNHNKSAQPSECGSHSSNHNKPVKLPTIQLPKFSGSYDDWLEFRDTFHSLIHSNENIDIITKFHYLRASLEGSAAVVIQSIQFCALNYSTAWKLLCDRYDNKRLLIQNHVSSIFNIDKITRESSNTLKRMMDQFTKSIRTLQALGEPVQHWDTLLIYILAHKLDSKTFREWEEFKGRLDHDLPITMHNFVQFIKMRTDLLETIELSQSTTQQNNNTVTKPYKHKAMVSVDSSQTTNSNSLIKSTSPCPRCSGDHKLINCPQFLSLTNETRLKLLPSYKVCFNCFNSGHYANKCKKSGCKLCKRRHNTLIHVAEYNVLKPVMHRDREPHVDKRCSSPSTEGANPVALAANVSASSKRCDGQQVDVLLSTVLIKLFDVNNREHIARAVLDSGSTSCLMTSDLHQKLNLPYSHINQSILGINNVISHINKMCFVPMMSLSGDFATNLRCFVLPSLTDNVPSRSVDLRELNIPTNLPLADPSFHEPAAIDIILGADIFWDVIGTQKLNLGFGKPILCETKLGWIVSGPIINKQSHGLSQSFKCHFSVINPESVSSTDSIQNQLTRFWSLEEVSQRSDYSSEHKLCEEHFINNTTRVNGQFCVKIPLKENPSILGNSLHRATQCFLSLERRLLREPTLCNMYREFMTEYEALGHMSECKLSQTDNAHFIPHHGVLRMNSTTTKLRAVFNASSKTSNGVTFNSLQMVGPTVQDDLLSILLRFRLHKYILMADVEKMYRQILVHPDDRHLQQIVWRDSPNKPLMAYQLNTVTYGTASAPFLATRCLKQLGLDCQDKRVSEIILHDFFVDDLLSGGDNINEVLNLRKILTSTLASAHFHLRKWKSNVPTLVSDTSQSPLDLNIGNNEPSKTLGLGWRAESDELCFPIGILISKINTKRSMLSIMSQIFDPLGMVAPIVISMKMLLQQLWLHKLSWDEPIPSTIEDVWVNIVNKLHLLNNINIPRRIVLDKYELLEFHIFSDASEKAYGACLYVRSIDTKGNIMTRLLIAKSRVAPIKPLTIPRLELCGALLGTRLYERVINSLKIKPVRTIFWTDSTILLGWLKMLPSKLHTFVRNRIGEILDKTSNCVWRHVPTEHNPADFISRGVNVESIESLNMWWSGPDFLKEASINWPSNLSVNEVLPETRTEISYIVTTNDSSKLIKFIDFDRFSNLNRLKRAVVYVLRFKNACRKQLPKDNYLSHTELDDALNVIIRISQAESFIEYNLLINNKKLPNKSPLLKFNVFLDQFNVMRVGGRLGNSDFDYDKKHPILIQSTHRFSKLLFELEHIKLMHAGPQLLLASIRETYWPIGGRNLAKACYRRCVKCSRMKGSVIAPLMGNLPRQRLSPGGYPFRTIGVDYAGPISSASRQGRGCRIVKVYIVIFVCFATKAIHLELVGDLTSNNYLLALRRFISRRGKPSQIYSDNGTTFVGAYNDLAKFLKDNGQSLSSDLANEGIEFHFIPAYSPHFGGIWEAGVKSTKFHLVRVLGNCNLSYEELNTTLVQIEAILNSRPLTPLSSQPEDMMPLTPGHFLIGRPLTSLPTKDLQDNNFTHLNRFHRIEQLRQHFWRRWSKEYISELQQRTKWRTENTPLKIDALVVIKEDNLPPLKWRLGRIVALHPGSDNVARVADIKTSSGVIRRSFSKICPLPLDDGLTVERQAFNARGHVRALTPDFKQIENDHGTRRLNIDSGSR